MIDLRATGARASFYQGEVPGLDDRYRRVSPVAVHPDEGPFTIPFAEIHQCKPVEFTAYALASRLRASWMEARVTKVARVSARFSKSLARRRFRPNHEKVRPDRRLPAQRAAAVDS